ncbi:MAG TPA: MG2 domain-containing protein [Thermoanaerobaculia bacterium]|nr:MG2 domain-containing protein [Thermoanaerobaculia bacterium]
MIRHLFALITFFLLATSSPSSYDALKREAEKFFNEKSFAKAHEIYVEAGKLDLSADDRRWVAFRLADTAWRGAVGDAPRDQTALNEIVNSTNHDRVWAEANESLGDLTRNFTYYAAALDWWAGSDDLDLARRRYLAMVRRMAESGYYGQAIPREVLVNAIAIAQSPQDALYARYLLAQQLLGEGRPESIERALEHLDVIIAAGKSSEWYDDALYRAAQSYSSGRNVVVNGQVESAADYTRALELYRRLVNEFTKAESPFRDDAERAIDTILQPAVQLSLSGTFLPDSEQEVMLMWRNTKAVQLTLTPVDVTSYELPAKGTWIDGLRLDAKPVRQWTYETNDRGDHVPGYHNMRLEPRLERGAYLMTASADGKSAKALVMVTDAHILLHSSPTQLQIYVSDVLSGAPIAGAKVRVSQQRNDNKEWVRDATTNSDGLAIVSNGDTYGSIVITAASGKARQAWHSTYAYGGYAYHDQAAWHIYAFTDRPAYRPNETVQWKIIARTRSSESWSTPSGQTIAWEIQSPRGEKIASGDAKLNAFGSFWAALPLTESMPLGAYQVIFKPLGSGGQLGNATLFRLEEYKLPEYRVSVSTGPPVSQSPGGAGGTGQPGDRATGQPLYRLGETVEATIDASYYFGGPVANATVEAVVYQKPFVRYWYPWHVYHWYYDTTTYEDEGQILKRETLKTDANGRAVIRIETTRDQSDMKFRIEARVTDASRREVRGQGTVAVTKQRYTVLVQPEHYIHRPGDRVEIAIKAVDANEQPVQASGTIKVMRREWREKQRAYRDEDVLETKVTTDAKGEATFTFTPKSNGYYVVVWTSEDRDPKQPARVRDLVAAQTTVWVADRATTDLGYFSSSGLDVIVDKDTVRAGQTASAMIVAPVSGRWVVLNTTGDDILDTQVVHLDGTVKLVQIPIDSRHEPNFYVTATSVFDRSLATDSERIVVPPVEHFLNVEVKTDREQYQPRDEGTITVTTRDEDGKPVAAEVALSVSDQAVTAIQAELAGDPRQFFFGETRQQFLQLSAGLHTQQYIRLVEGQDKQLLDDRYKEGRRERDAESGVKGGWVVDGVGALAEQRRDGYGYAANAIPTSVAPPPPPAPSPVAEAITVTGSDAPLESLDVQVTVRSDFRSTAFWQPDVVTDANGVARVKFKYPEALTTWEATARAATAGAQFGSGETTARTNMPLIVRLQAPRFFVAGDQSTVSAVINNNTDDAMRVEPKLDVEGLTLNMTTNTPQLVPAHGEARYDWSVVADRPGPVKLRVSGRSARYADGMEKSFTVYEHGIDKLIARAGKTRAEETVVKLELPRERRATDLVVQVTPSLAVTMLDALPYLVDYPYGCTEQTMSRFLPAAIVAKTLRGMGLDAKKRIPKLDAVTAASLARLYDFQHDDGGWGWWKEGDSDAFMTAYVVWGFSIARDAEMKVDTERVENAFRWLNENLREHDDDWSLQAWMLHAMSAWNSRQSKASEDVFNDVWEHRDRLTSYSRALLALTAHRYGAKEREQVLLRNLENGAKVDGNTVHWGADDFWWRWHDGPVETTAFVLQALVAIDPKHRLVEPAMTWLVRNRRGAQWSNTRDTAITVFAFNDYLRASGEIAREVTYEVSVNGKVIATKTLAAKDLLDAPSRFHVDAALLRDTDQEIRIRASAPVYYSAEARFVSLEEPVKPAGNELFVRREYFRLAPKPTLLKGVVYDRIPLRDGESIVSGERVEVVCTIETKNNYEYLLFEDLKPAGFEAVALQSGEALYATNANGQEMQWIYQELRDRKVAMFADHLAQGTWEIRYTLRAETPGSFHALPLLGQAMYVPDIRSNSDELRVVVRER